MSISISPYHNIEDFTAPPTTDVLIDIFEAQVKGWQLGVAKEMTDKQVGHRAFAQLHILTSYFEMIAQFMRGETSDRASKEFFVEGILSVFPDTKQLPSQVMNDLLDILYKSVRCGLYHSGRVKEGIILSGEIVPVIYYDTQNNEVWIDPDKLVAALDRHFTAYIARLRDPANKQLRVNFEKRFLAYR